MRAKSGLKGVLAVGAVAGAVVAARVTLARRRLMGPVLPELRHPLLLVPVHFGPGDAAPDPPGAGPARTCRAGGRGRAAHRSRGRGAPRGHGVRLRRTRRAARPSGRCCGSTAAGYVMGHPATYHEALQPVRCTSWASSSSASTTDWPPSTRSRPASRTATPRWNGCMTTRTSWASTNPGSPSAGTAPAGVWPPPWPSSLHDRGRGSGVLPAVGLPDARRPDRSAYRSRRHRLVRVDPEKQRIRLDAPISGTRPAMTRTTAVRGARAAGGPDRPTPGLDRGRGPGPVP